MALRQFVKSYQGNKQGNIAIMFAVSLLVLIIGAGAAVDFGMAQRTETKLQNTADAAVLAAAKTGKNDQAYLQTVADKFVKAQYPGAGLNTKVQLLKNGRVRVFVDTVYKTSLMHIIGRPTINVKVVSEAPLTSSEPVNIALVLDTTGSMKGTKLASLKTAANNLVTTLASYKNPSLKMSVVPFAQHVNVGMANRNAPWINVPADSTTTGPKKCGWKKKVTGYKNCHIVHSTCYNDGTPYACSWKSCDVIYGPKEWKCHTPKSSVKWHGCVGSRNTPWHERVAYKGRKVPGLMNTWCGTKLRPLTNNLKKVKSTINALNASGYTYIPAGLMWGWRTLDTNMPLTQASGPFAKNTQKVMILMSDGANTRSKNGKAHTGWDVNAANKEMKILCNKIKGEEIEVYTIAYDIKDSATKNRMKSCATDASKFFDASNAAQLNNAFKAIGANLIRLRLTH